MGESEALMPLLPRTGRHHGQFVQREIPAVRIAEPAGEDRGAVDAEPPREDDAGWWPGTGNRVQWDRGWRWVVEAEQPEP